MKTLLPLFFVASLGCSPAALSTAVNHAGAVVNCLDLIKRCVDLIQGEVEPMKIAEHGVQCYKKQKASQCTEAFEGYPDK